MGGPDQEHDEQIVRLISGSQRRLFLYLFGLLYSRELAEDALQETNVVLWRKRSQYEPGSNFFAWACRIAYLEACKAREQRRRKIPAFTDVFMDGMAAELFTVVGASDVLQATLRECIEQLKAIDRELIERRYDDGATTKTVASSVGRSTDAVYKALSRIHRNLFDCITKKMSEGDEP